MSAERRSRYLRVVRPGSGAGSDAAVTPPLPVEPPLTPPIWLDPPQVPPHVPPQTPTRGASGGSGSGQAGGLPGGSSDGHPGVRSDGGPDAQQTPPAPRTPWAPQAPSAFPTQPGRTSGPHPVAHAPAAGSAQGGADDWSGRDERLGESGGADVFGRVGAMGGFGSDGGSDAVGGPVGHAADGGTGGGANDGAVRAGAGAYGSPASARNPYSAPAAPVAPAGHGLFAPQGDGSGYSPFGEDPVEAALRASLHQAVTDIRPAPDSLARLRRAVPQRRALRRRAYTGAAVAASLALLGLTALHSLGPSAVTSAETNPAGPVLPGVHPSATGKGHGGNPADPSTPGAPRPGGSAYPSRTHGVPGTVLVPLPSGGVTTVATAAGAHSLAPAATLAECTRGQLGNGAAGVAPADSSGVVYGSFAISNISATPCKVSGAGSVDVMSPVGTSASNFTVTPHTAGDPAVSLPAPDPAHPAVALAPGQSYVVDFAFVPAPCPGSSSAGPSSSASATPATPNAASAGATGSGATAGAAATPGDPSANPGSPGGTSGGAGGTTSTGGTSGGTGNPSPTPASIQLASVPSAGGAVAARTTLQGACAGTVYRTDPLAAPR